MIRLQIYGFKFRIYFLIMPWQDGEINTGYDNNSYSFWLLSFVSLLDFLSTLSLNSMELKYFSSQTHISNSYIFHNDNPYLPFTDTLAYLLSFHVYALSPW